MTVLVADGADEGRRKDTPAAPRATPAEFAAAARALAAQSLHGAFVCRGCALRLVEELVLSAVTTALADARRAIEEQTRWPN